MNIAAIISREFEYDVASMRRRTAFQQASIQYQEEFERAYQRRIEQRDEARKHWNEVVIPRILREAALVAYEREMTERICQRSTAKLPQPCGSAVSLETGSDATV